MKKSPKFSPEVRERAVRMVQEHRADHPSQWAAIESIAGKMGCAPQTLHTWVRQHEVDAGQRDGVSSRCGLPAVARMGSTRDFTLLVQGWQSR